MLTIEPNDFTDTRRADSVAHMMEAALLLERSRTEDPDIAARPVDDVPTALLAECSCPGWCERDHDRD
jgi:hypothetical protein